MTDVRTHYPNLQLDVYALQRRIVVLEDAIVAIVDAIGPKYLQQRVRDIIVDERPAALGEP